MKKTGITDEWDLKVRKAARITLEQSYEIVASAYEYMGMSEEGRLLLDLREQLKLALNRREKREIKDQIYELIRPGRGGVSDFVLPDSDSNRMLDESQNLLWTFSRRRLWQRVTSK